MSAYDSRMNSISFTGACCCMANQCVMTLSGSLVDREMSLCGCQIA